MRTMLSTSSRIFKKPAFIGWTVFILLAGLVAILSYQRYLFFKELRSRAQTTAAMSARDKLNSVLENSESATRILGFIISYYNNKQDFEVVAERLLQSNQYIDALELVEQGTITKVYPKAGNEVAIGYNILNDSLVNKEALRAIQERRLFFAGPIILKQGYAGIVGRLPLYTEGKFWGFSAAIVKLSTLIDAAELAEDDRKDFIFQLSKKDPNTGEEKFFLPQSGEFKSDDWAAVSVKDGDWTIYARAARPFAGTGIASFIILGILFAVSGGWFAWYGARQPYRLHQLVSEKTLQLKRSEERYFSFFENASDTIIVYNRLGLITEVNSRFCKLLGFERQELIGLNLSQLIDLAESTSNLDDLKFELPDKEMFTERRFVKRDGDIVDLEMSVKMIDDDHYLAIGRDLTDIRKAQKQIAISESTLRGAFEHSAIGMALVSPDGKWIKVNRTLCQMLGYSETELLEMSFKDVTHPDDQEGGMQFLSKAFQTNANLYHTEKRYITKGGGNIWVNLNVSSVRDAQGQLLYFVTQTEDITEKKKTEELLQVREQQLRLFVEYSPAALAMFDRDMRYLITSNRWISAYGLEGKQVLGKIHYELFPDNPHRWREIHQYCLQGNSARSEEDLYVDENGKTIWLRWEVHPWRHFNGDVGGIILFTEIITKLKEAEMKFRKLVEQSLFGVCIIQDEKFTYVNPRFAEIFGFTASELTNSVTAIDIIGNAYHQLVSLLETAGINEDTKSAHLEIFAKRKDSEEVCLEVYGVLASFDGKSGILLTLLDVTDRRKSEEMIRDSEEKRRMIMDAALDAIVSIDDGGNIIAWNPQAVNMFGWSEEEALGRPLAETIIPAQFREQHLKGMERYLKTGDGPILHKLVEVAAINKNGDEFPVELTIIPVLRKDEISFTAFVRDIAERKRAQDKLKESEEMFRNLVEKSLAGVYIIQDGLVRYINPAHQKIMGYSLQELQNIGDVEKLVHEADIPMFRAFHENAGSTAAGQNQYGLRAIRKDGAIVYLEVTTSGIVYEGRPALIGTMLDITDRVEEEIRVGRAVNEAQERERMQIGMELHDNVKQIMAVALLTVDYAKANLTNPKLATDSLEQVKKLTKDAIDELRRLSHQLAPAIDKTDLFADEIRYLVATIKTESKLAFDINVPDDESLLPKDVRLAFYRMIQEQINNVIKYADATTVSITVKTTSTGSELLIRDNGKGFDPTQRSNGIGLENIRRRAFVLGGTAKIISGPGQGCEVVVTIPCKAAEL